MRHSGCAGRSLGRGPAQGVSETTQPQVTESPPKEGHPLRVRVATSAMGIPNQMGTRAIRTSNLRTVPVHPCSAPTEASLHRHGNLSATSEDAAGGCEELILGSRSFRPPAKRLRVNTPVLPLSRGYYTSGP